MQAVVLAGGFGTRLHPLTHTIPKPMMPVLNRPFLEYPLRHLGQHDVQEAFLTLYHLPRRIQEHFGDEFQGLTLHYAVEEEPLGTAGGVKVLESKLRGTFLVVNGDIFTDVDLTAALAFHREMGAVATIVLTRVEDPTAFGMVETDAEARILRFVEKPAPERVTTPWVNAGTYILEPEVLRYAPAGKPFMFERGLFPRLLEAGLPLYAYRSEAYWLDLGTPQNYLKLHSDLLQGTVPGDPSGDASRPGLWVGDGCQIAPNAQLHGPIFMGRGCTIGPEVRLRGPVTLGDGCTLEDESEVVEAVVWNGARVGRNARLEGCILGNNVTIAEGAHVGPNCILADDATVSPRKRLEPGSALGPGERV